MLIIGFNLRILIESDISRDYLISNIIHRPSSDHLSKSRWLTFVRSSSTVNPFLVMIRRPSNLTGSPPRDGFGFPPLPRRAALISTPDSLSPDLNQCLLRSSPKAAERNRSPIAPRRL